jgi:hypothetical protein
VVYDTELVALMHDRYHLILKLVVNCRAASQPTVFHLLLLLSWGLVLVLDIFSIRFSLSIGPNLNLANIVMIS